MLTRPALAQALGVHPQTITKWERDGMPVAKRGARGTSSRYDRRAVETWLQAREQARQTSDVASLQLERARQARAQALVSLQIYQMRAKELLPKADVERVWAQHVAAVRAQLLTLPVTLADRLHHAAKTEGVAAVERILTEAVHDVLRELSGPSA
jgi:phage terminase Nu1 subunit (DNA packaging protein)